MLQPVGGAISSMPEDAGSLPSLQAWPKSESWRSKGVIEIAMARKLPTWPAARWRRLAGVVLHVQAVSDSPVTIALPLSREFRGARDIRATALFPPG